VTPPWFADLPVLGQFPPDEAVSKLREVGEEDLARAIESAARSAKFSPATFGMLDGLFPTQPWQHATHAFGYLSPGGPGSELVPLQHAGNIEPDPTLKGARIRITLNQLRVAKYPGSGTHRIHFEFAAQNQASGQPENLNFNATYKVRDGERAGIVGYPIFVGLNVGTEGVAFSCFTINVANDEDEARLSMLESNTFRAGLKLASVAQPAIAPLSEMAMALTRSLLSRRRNVPIQNFYLGLDFTNLRGGARLAEGSYLAVQIPEALELIWDWDEWVYHPPSGQVVNKDEPTRLIPYNYILFGVNRYSE
jgi:hypothetical protein